MLKHSAEQTIKLNSVANRRRSSHDVDNLTKGKDEKKSEFIRGHTASVECLKFFLSSSGTLRLASGSIDSTVLIWNPSLTKKDTPLVTLRGHTGPVMCLDSFTKKDGEHGNPSKPGSPIIVSGGEDRTIRVWNPEERCENPLVATLTGHRAPIFGVVCFNSPNGAPRVASASEDTTVRVWDIDTKDTPSLKVVGGVVSRRSKRGSIGGSDVDPCLMVLEGHSGWVNTVASYTVVGPGRIKGVTTMMPRIVSGSMDNSVRIWDPEGGRLAVLKGHRSWVHSVVCFVTQSGQHRVASASTDHTIRIWDPLSPSGGAMCVFNGHRQHVWCIAAFDDKEGRPRIVSGGEDRTIRTWNPSQHVQVHLYSGHNRPVKCLATFQSSEGQRCIASGGEDNFIRLWESEVGLPGQVMSFSDREAAVLKGNGTGSSELFGSVLGDMSAITAKKTDKQAVDTSNQIDVSEAGPLSDWLAELHPNCSSLLNGFCLHGVSFHKLHSMEAVELDTVLTSMEVTYGQRRAIMTAHALSKVNDDDDIDNLLDEEDEDSLGEDEEGDEEEEPHSENETSDKASGVLLPPI